MKRILFYAIFLLTTVPLSASDPTDTRFSYADCEGSAMPYPAPEQLAALPDSLTPVFVNHIGRHGARFLSSPKDCVDLITILNEAKQAGGLSESGKRMMHLTQFIADSSHNRWGALDSLGMAEERGIASRMFRAYGMLFNDAKIYAISSYSPRCVMSMYEFTHQLDRLNNHQEIYTSAGRQNSPLMRFFDTDSEFQSFLRDGDWKQAWEMQYQTSMPATPARKLFAGEYAKSLSTEKAQEVSYLMFKILQGMSAMGIPSQMDKYFTLAETNAAWSCTNLRHYLQRSATTLSPLPAEIAAPLLVEFLTTAEEAAQGKSEYRVMLRFGHAETLMPLLSLLRLKGCYYLTNYFDTTALHWQDFNIVPMGANLQMVMARSTAGKLYVRFDLNEQPIPLLPGSDDIIIPWEKARDYMLRCIPLHLRP